MSTEPPDEPTDPPQTHERPPTTEDHMDRLADGDRLALAAISDAVAPALREYLARHIQADHLDTTIQQILLELYRGRHTYIRGADVKVWAFSFARHFIPVLPSTEASRYADVFALVMHGFCAAEIAGILDVPIARVLAQLEKIRNKSEESASTLRRAASDRASTSDGDDDALVGTEIGNYRIASLEDSGGFGQVYRATHIHQKKPRAIKVMRECPDDDPTAFERFMDEANVIQKLSHPNIVKVYDTGILGSRGWYAMEFLTGVSLAKLLGKSPNKRLPWARVAKLVGQICAGLAEVHRYNIVHGDIKPANCFVVDDGDATETVKLIDFGTAKPAARAGHAVAPPNAIVGTEHYVAPELLDGRPADARADIYAVGVMMFEMLTGRLPFDAVTSHALAAQKALGDVPTLRSMGLSVPRGIERVVRRALAREVADRFQSITELSAAIAALGESGRDSLPFSFLTRGTRARMVATASLSACFASVFTAWVRVEPPPDPPKVPELTAAHIAATLAPARPRFDECQGELADDTTRVKAKLLVLGATGQVINTELLGIAKDTDAGECISDALFKLRFPRFDARQEQIECEL